MQTTRETTRGKAFRLTAEFNNDKYITENRRDDIRTWLYNNGYILHNRAGTWRLIDRHTQELVKEDK